MFLSCTVSDNSTSNNGLHLKSGLIIDHSRLLNVIPVDRSHTSSYWCSAVTMTLSCIISEIKRDIGRKSRFLYPICVRCYFHQNIAITFSTEKLERWGYLAWWKVWEYVYSWRYNAWTCQTDRYTDGQTPYEGIDRAMHCVARQKKQKTIQRFNLEESWPTSEVTGRTSLEAKKYKVKVTEVRKGRAAYCVGHCGRI